MAIIEDQIYDMNIDEIQKIKNILEKRYHNDETMSDSDIYLLSLFNLVLKMAKKLRELEK